MADVSKKEIMKNAIDKVKIVDAGIKDKYGYDSPVKSSSDPKNKIYYPSLRLSAKEAPMLAGTDVGTEVTMIVKGCVTSHSMNESTYNNKKDEDFTLEIRGIGIMETGKKVDYKK